jgi:hypothetical protein
MVLITHVPFSYVGIECLTRDTERSERMLSQEIVHQDFRPVGDTFATPANSGQEELSLLVATQEAEEVRAALARVLEHADIEAQDVLTQAEEALVLG